MFTADSMEVLAKGFKRSCARSRGPPRRTRAFRLEDANLPLLAAFPQLLRRGFVRSYDAAASLQVDGRAPPEGERDLRYAQAATSRPLAAFGAPPRSLARWFVAAGLLALALRAFLR